MTLRTSSSRHPKILGDFGEHFVLYELSKQGYECAVIDHTGIDLIAKHPSKKKLLGISVKSSTIKPHHTGKPVVKRCKDCKAHLPGNDVRKCDEKCDIYKIKQACAAFGCEPYFAVVTVSGTDDAIRGYLMSLKYIMKLNVERGREGNNRLRWFLKKEDLIKWRGDSEVEVFEYVKHKPLPATTTTAKKPR